MDIRTSTPIVIPKNFEQSSRLSEISTSWKLNPQLLPVNNKNKMTKVNDSWYSKVDGPCYVDFQNGVPDPRDSFFDGNISTPIPQKKEQSNLLTPNIDIISSLQRCSISRIDYSSDENSTLKASDCTVRELQNSRHSILSNSPDPQRRLSRQSLTTVKPFSFELREKERRERLEAKQQYINILKEQYKVDTFKVKPVSKFKSAKKVQNAGETNAKIKLITHLEKIKNVEQKKKVLNLDKSNFQTADKSNTVKVLDQLQLENCTKKNDEIKIIKNQASSVTGQVKKIIKIFDKEEPPDPVKVHSTHEISVEINDKPVSVIRINPSKPLVANVKNIQVKNIPQVENKKDSNDSRNKKQAEPWKQRPFQVSLPKRTACIPRSPKLRTAQRARARQLFDDQLKEKEKQLEVMQKKDAAVKEKHERQEIQKLRKQLVHKAIPIPATNSKRTLTDPIIPIFVKRRKLNNQHNTNSKNNNKVVK